MKHRERIKIMLFAPSLRGGGAERVTVHLIKHLDRRRFDPTLVLVQEEGEFLDSVPDDVQLIGLNRARVRYALPDLVRLLRVNKPDILLGVMRHTNATAVTAKLLARSRARVVLTEHSPMACSIGTASESALRRLVFRLLYPLSDRVVTVSDGVAADLADTLSLCPAKTVTIYNPVVDATLQALMNQTVSHPWFSPDRAVPLILGCGRLVRPKGFRYLVEAVALIRSHTPVRLSIAGKGPEEACLRQLIQDLQLSECVELMGFRSNPYKLMARADLFVLPSLWEGLGLALVEAMACGTPVVSTKCPSGPGEIITDGVNGLLVPPANAEALGEAILHAVTDPQLADRLRREGQRRAHDFTVDRSVRLYERLFVQLLNEERIP